MLVKNLQMNLLIRPCWDFGATSYNVAGNVHVVITPCLYVSESDILGLVDYQSDIENLISFEWAMFEDYSFKQKMIISPLRNACLKHHEQCIFEI